MHVRHVPLRHELGMLTSAKAAELGITPGAVRAAQFRVLCRLRQELAGLLD